MTFYELSPYEWHSYQEAGEIVSYIGSALKYLKFQKGDYIGFYCDTCAEWFLMCNGVFTQSMVAVTVYANIGTEGITHAFIQTKIPTLFTSGDLLNNVLPYSFPFLLLRFYK